MTLRSRWKFHTQRGMKMHRLTLLNLTVCRVRGHRWGDIATGMLGVCDRCFRDYDPFHDHDPKESA
jgi:hypothetical protein